MENEEQVKDESELMRVYREGCELRKKLVACEITQDEYDSAIERLVQDA